MCGGSVLFDEPQARRGGDGQGEADGLRLARHARVAHDGGHDVVALVAVDDDVDHFLFGGKGNAEEFFRALHAGALGVDDRAARRAAGRVHDQIAVAVVGDDDQKLVFRVLHGGFLPLFGSFGARSGIAARAARRWS